MTRHAARGLAGAAILAVAALLLTLAGCSHSRRAATIATDKPDYPPGHTVTLTGQGWAPGETVMIVLHRDHPVHGDERLTSVADSSGKITNTDFAPASYDLGVRFFVTAKGETSNRRAQTTFTDAAITWAGSSSTEWNTGANWSTGNVPGSGDDVTIPAGVASGRYPVVSTAAANAKTVTLATGAGTPPSLTVSANTLTVAGNFKVDAGTVTHSGGTITATAGAGTITGTLNESGGTFLSSVTLTVASGGNVNVSGSGIIHMASTIGTNPTDAIIISAGGTITQSGGSVELKDFTTTAGSPDGTYNQSSGTLVIYHDFKSSGTFDATGGTVEFAAAGGAGTWPSSTGPTQFFNLLLDVDPVFDGNAAVSFSVAGDWTSNAAVDLSGKATIVTFNGTGAQTIGGTGTTTFRGVTINTASGTATLAHSETVKSGDLTVTAGTLDLSSYTMNRSASGGTLTVSNGATLKIGGTNSFPTNYATHTLGATSTVEYNGSAQTVTAESYGHLTLSGSGTKTMPGSAMTIAGNFRMSGTASATAAQALTVNLNFSLGSGTTFGAASYSHGVKGNFSNSGTFTASTSTFTFNGTSAQTIGGTNATTFNALTLSNSAGVSLSAVDATVGGTLTLTSGKITTGAGNKVVIPASGSVSRTSGHVVGNFQKNVATGATSRTFEVGDASSYTPVSVAFASVTTAGDLTASTAAGDHPNIGTASINAAKSVNRYWSLTNSGILFTNYSATLTFVAGDIDGGATTSSFVVGKYSSGAWSYPTVGTKTATTTQVTGVTVFSDYQIGEPNVTTLGNGTDPGNASVAPGGAATMDDAFTVVTNSGAESISAVSVTLAAGSSGGLSLVEITNDAGSTVYGSAADPGSDTPAITLTTPITATTASTQYKIRITPKSHANMPAPVGSTYSVTALLSSWTGASTHAGSDSAGTTVTIDNLSPGNVTASSATAGNTQVSLAWTNPGDADLGSIVVLRRASSAVTDTPVEGTTYSVGNTVGSSTVACVVAAPTATCSDTGLTNGTAYHYKIFARDTNGNYATGATPSGSPVTPTVTTLANGTDPANASLAPGGAATMADAFTFATASGTDAITAVTVTLASGTSGGLSLVEITNDAGSTVYGSAADPGSDTPAITLTTNITATTSATQYKIRITPRSHANMPVPPGSSYSVTAFVSNWTGTNVHAGSDSAGTTVTIDNLSPGNVTASSATAGNTQVSLAWTNPGDADLGGIVVLRRASSAVTDTPVEGTTYTVGNTVGSSTVACVVTAPTAVCSDTGLSNGTAYHYKIFARDTNGNYATGATPSGSPATPFGVYQPDAMIKLSSEADAAYLTDNTYETTAAAQSKAQGVVSGTTAVYRIQFQNDGNGPDGFTITGTATAAGFTVQYLDDASTDRTAAVIGSGYTISGVASGASKVWTLNVTPSGSSPHVDGGSSYTVFVTATSTTDTSKKDQVKAVTTSTSAVLTLVKAVDKSSASPGEDVAYTTTASNGSALTDAATVVLTDPVPANTRFKLGGATFNAGTSGLSCGGGCITYSSDGGSSWTYAPVSGGCSAPAGYDGCATNVKWSMTGTMATGTSFSTGLIVGVK